MEGFTNHLVVMHYSPHREEMQSTDYKKYWIKNCELTYFIAMLHNHIVKNNP